MSPSTLPLLWYLPSQWLKILPAMLHIQLCCLMPEIPTSWTAPFLRPWVTLTPPRCLILWHLMTHPFIFFMDGLRFVVPYIQLCFWGENSATKFANICPLTEFLGLYMMSKAPEVVPHLALVLVKSDLLSNACKGCLVKT